MKRSILLLLLILGIFLNVVSADTNTPKVVIRTVFGDIGLELFPDKSPITVDNFLQYVNSGFYDEIIFHRAIYGFMIQTGSFELSPTPPPYLLEKTDGLRAPIINESYNGLLNERGAVAMALLPDEPNSATSGFYINQVHNSHLDGVHCVFGRVISGIEGVDWVASLPTYTIDGLEDVPLFEYEGYYYWVYVIETIMAPPGYWLSSDLNNNGIVSVTDFAIFANNWMARGDQVTGDINEQGPDGIVDYLDLAVFSEQWLLTTDWY